MSKAILWILAVCCTLWKTRAYSYTVADATKLEQDLISGYSRICRPSSKTIVRVNFGISSINALNNVDQEISINGFMNMYWTDLRLAFDSTLYGGMTSTMMKSTQIWVPPIMLGNAADGSRLLGDDSQLASIPISVKESGIIYWLLPTFFNAQCSLNIKYYPFDSQTCTLSVSSFMYNAAELYLAAGSTEINTDIYEVNGEWDLIGSSVGSAIKTLLGYPMPVVNFSINLKRKYSYYLLNMILPVIFLSFLGTFVFLLPVESGEKVGFSLTILLSLSVVLTIVSDSIPPTSENICLLSIYLLSTFLVCATEVLLTVVSILLSHTADLGYEPSPFLQKFMKKFLSKVAFYVRADEKKSKNNVDNDNNNQSKSKEDMPIKDVVELVDVRGHETDSPTAWDEKKAGDISDDDGVDYTYKDLSIMIDKINFVLFSFCTVAMIAWFLIQISTEG